MLHDLHAPTQIINWGSFSWNKHYYQNKNTWTMFWCFILLLMLLYPNNLVFCCIYLWLSILIIFHQLWNSFDINVLISEFFVFTFRYFPIVFFPLESFSCRLTNNSLFGENIFKNDRKRPYHIRWVWLMENIATLLVGTISTRLVFWCRLISRLYFLNSRIA